MTAELSLTGIKGFSRTTQANVMDYLRRAILAGELPPGTRLVQAELAAALKVSVTPIREALWELSSQGLVDLDAFRGAVVHRPTRAELEDIFEVRAALLPASVRRGVQHMTPDQLRQAAAILTEMEAEADQTRWIALNRDFHRQLYGPQPNRHLYEVLERLADIATIYINLSFGHDRVERRASEQEHRQILVAYQAQDVEQAIALSLGHIQSTLEAARQALAP
ncbi:GntR family transcriptional regulator [Nodosilinea sp. LEGE 07088]|uniref:GntR family transcriptional regulator n=1 Tax=Nodosilinea sp. LEGE 07088 TaxID=2777968 RepID=UPI00187DF12F|nr:GntR family transcriptional regulator [Nodosilinea sp. LEGE 07088]MBE9138874.1 GntR family transcriptional regulator [Nodosilinea sp. LEGE 07088]